MVILLLPLSVLFDYYSIFLEDYIVTIIQLLEQLFMLIILHLPIHSLLIPSSPCVNSSLVSAHLLLSYTWHSFLGWMLCVSLLTCRLSTYTHTPTRRHRHIGVSPHVPRLPCWLTCNSYDNFWSQWNENNSSWHVVSSSHTLLSSSIISLFCCLLFFSFLSLSPSLHTHTHTHVFTLMSVYCIKTKTL